MYHALYYKYLLKYQRKLDYVSRQTMFNIIVAKILVYPPLNILLKKFDRPLYHANDLIKKKMWIN